MIVWWFSSHQMSGRIHRGDYNCYSRSPLSEPVLLFSVLVITIFNSDVGENTQERS